MKFKLFRAADLPPIFDKPAFLSEVAKTVNACYKQGEGELWQNPDHERTNAEEILSLIEANHLIIAFELQENGEIDVQAPLGSIKIDVDFNTELKQAQFGMLTVNQALQKQGLGRLLVEAAEAWAREKGCLEIRCEILSPSTWEHPMKVMLHKWYSERMGYKVGQPVDFKSMFADRAHLLSCECDFKEYVKKLV